MHPKTIAVIILPCLAALAQAQLTTPTSRLPSVPTGAVVDTFAPPANKVGETDIPLTDQATAYNAWLAKHPEKARVPNSYQAFQDSLTMDQLLKINGLVLTEFQKSLIKASDKLTAQGVSLQKQLDFAYSTYGSNPQGHQDIDVALRVMRFRPRGDQYPSGYTGIIDNTGRNLTLDDVNRLNSLPSSEFDWAVGPHGLNLNSEQQTHLYCIKIGAQYTPSVAQRAQLDGKGTIDYAGNYTDPYYGSSAFKQTFVCTGPGGTNCELEINGWGNGNTRLGDWKKPANWGATPNDGSNGSFYSPTMQRFVSAQEVINFFASNPSRQIVEQGARDLGIDAETLARVEAFVGFGTVHSSKLNRTYTVEEVTQFFASRPSDARIQEIMDATGISQDQMNRAKSASGF